MIADVGRGLARHRPLAGRLMFEFVVTVVGVTVAFAVESARQDRAEAAYRREMIAALIPTLDDIALHNRDFIRTAGAEIAAFDRDLARGGHPRLPVYREPGSERPPVRAWDGIVQTGVSKSLPPALYFELSRFYTRQESIGERYVRYADQTEREILPLGPGQRGIYDPVSGKLKPQYAAYVDRLREQIQIQRELGDQALALKSKLRAVD